MRHLIDLVSSHLHEADDPAPRTRTKTADRGRFDLLRALDPTPAAGSPLARQAGRGKTLRGVAAAQRTLAQNPAIRGFAGGFNPGDITDEIDDAEAARRAGDEADADTPAGLDVPRIGDAVERPTTENLPAVINRDLMVDGDRRVNPEWHQVKHLPGYMQQAIRAVSRQVFRQFTDTPLGDMQMICSLLNPAHEVAAVADWIRHNGVKEGGAHFDFGNIMPGYTADAVHWRTAGYDFLLLRDIGGEYIYGWAGGRGVHLGGGHATPRLNGPTAT